MKPSKKVHSDIELLQELPLQVESLLLKDLFSDYKNPRKKIFELTQKKYLIPFQKGRYINLKSNALKGAQMESLANSLYFPSYISAEWALQRYGLLTEGVRVITSVTMRRSAEFKTPLGVFSYEHVNKKRYPSGFALDKKGDFFIATPEKALLDYVNLRIGKVQWKTKEDIEEFITEDLRINLGDLLKMTGENDLQALTPLYHRNSKEARLIKWLLYKKGYGRAKSR